MIFETKKNAFIALWGPFAYVVVSLYDHKEFHEHDVVQMLIAFAVSFVLLQSLDGIEYLLRKIR